MRKIAFIERRSGCGLSFTVLFLFALSVQALPSSPADPFNYSRSTSFEYDSIKGRLSTVTTEPLTPELCSVTTLGYDAYGNVNSQTLANCAGASGRAKFAGRSVTQYFDAVSAQTIRVNGSTVNVSIPAGLFAAKVDNAITQRTLMQFDPRFGTPIRAQDPNGAVVRTDLDDFGRVVRTVAADGTSTISKYCILASTGADLSSNSEGCPTVPSNEVPGPAVTFLHTEPRNTADAKSGPFVRIYQDALGRVVRTVTESFDGPSQTAGRSGVAVVRDAVFDVYGMQVLQTEGYFLVSGSSNSTGANDVAVSLAQYDDFGRPSKVVESNPDGSSLTLFGGGTLGYGSYGSRRGSVTQLRYSGLSQTITDDNGRLRTIETNAQGLEARVTDALGAQISKQYDAFGLLLQAKDALQNSIYISYDTLGRRLLLSDPDNGVLQSCYDAIGQLKNSQNSKMRRSHTAGACPNHDDSDVTATSVENWNSYAYDRLGRLRQQRSPSDTIDWAYDTGTGALGRLSKSSTAKGATKSYAYDAIGRPLSSRMDISTGPSFASAISYDPVTGRLLSKTYPTGFKVGYGYTSLGYLSELKAQTKLDLSPLPTAAQAPGRSGSQVASLVTIPAGQALWSATAAGADGRLEKALLSSGVSSVDKRDGFGRLSAQSVSSPSSATLVQMSYAWDGLNNLSSRIDHLGQGTGAVSEVFGYDEVNRLKQFAVASPSIPTGQRQVNLQYNALGMMLSKSDVGNYRYSAQGSGEQRPHAPVEMAGSSREYDLNGNLVYAGSGKYRSLTYTEFNKVLTAVGPAGGPSYSWSYDEAGARVKEVRTLGAATRVLWYLHPDAVGGLGFEREVNDEANEARNENRHFLTAAGVNVGVVVSSGALPALPAGQTAPVDLPAIAAKKLEYWHLDHLGSLIATSDHAGVVTQSYAYDPFGQRRYKGGQVDASGIVVDWSPDSNKGTARGFTGHEERDDLGLINMNGRIYDDNAGLFLQADPLVGDPSNAQNYSRYAYVLNNPLNATDPSGYDNVTLGLVCVSNNKSCPHERAEQTSREQTAPASRGGDDFPSRVRLTQGGSFDSTSKYGYERYLDELMRQSYARQMAGYSNSGDRLVAGMGARPQTGATGQGVGGVRGTANPVSSARGVVGQIVDGVFDFGSTVRKGAEQSAAAFQNTPLKNILLDQVLPAMPQEAALGVWGKFAAGAKLGAAKGLAGVPGRVGSRINLSKEGMDHVIARHLSGKANASQFSLAEAELRSVLSSRAAVGSPVVRSVESADGIRYIREFDAGRVIGTDRFNGNQATSVMTIMTDRFGNLVSTFPGLLK